MAVRIKKNQIFAIAALSMLLCGARAFSAEPGFNFEPNSDSRSYAFTLSNTDNKAIRCERIEILADIGEDGCSKIVAVYRYLESSVVLAPEVVRTNPTFGLDFLHQTSRKSKSKNLIFCGTPTVNINCR